MSIAEDPEAHILTHLRPPLSLACDFSFNYFESDAVFGLALTYPFHLDGVRQLNSDSVPTSADLSTETMGRTSVHPDTSGENFDVDVHSPVSPVCTVLSRWLGASKQHQSLMLARSLNPFILTLRTLTYLNHSAKSSQIPTQRSLLWFLALLPYILSGICPACPCVFLIPPVSGSNSRSISLIGFH
jgi:hypothetical protein